MFMKKITIQEIKGFFFGHADNKKALTGCTVILTKNGAVAGVDVRGGSPGTRETDVLKAENMVDEVHGVFLSGGSAFGLDVGGGVMDYLEQKDIGFDVRVTKVPIVPGAILFDLYPGDPSIRPDKQMGIEACRNAFNKTEFLEGSVGAGTGATVGKAMGYEHAMRGGIGGYEIEYGELQIGSVVAVNALGDVIDQTTNLMLASAYDRRHNKFLQRAVQVTKQIDFTTNRFSKNTTIGAIVTNAQLTKAQANKIASIAHDGLANTIKPSHLFVDGDTLFTLTTNKIKTDLNVLGTVAIEVVEQAVINAVKHATSFEDIPSYKQITKLNA